MRRSERERWWVWNIIHIGSTMRRSDWSKPTCILANQTSRPLCSVRICNSRCICTRLIDHDLIGQLCSDILLSSRCICTCFIIRWYSIIIVPTDGRCSDYTVTCLIVHGRSRHIITFHGIWFTIHPIGQLFFFLMKHLNYIWGSQNIVCWCNGLLQYVKHTSGHWFHGITYFDPLFFI